MHYLGAGGLFHFSNLESFVAPPWEWHFDTDSNSGDSIILEVGITNVRNLEAFKLSKFLTKIGLSAAGGIGGAVVPAAEIGGKIALSLLGAIGGGVVGEIFDDLFGETPDCVGLVFSANLNWTSLGIANLPYISNGGYYGMPAVYATSHEALPAPSPGAHCGTPDGVLYYSIAKTENAPSFGEIHHRPPQLQAGNTKISHGSFAKQWSDEPSSPFTRVFVNIWKSEAGLKDSFDVLVKEVAETPHGTVVVAETFRDISVTVENHLKGKARWYGKLLNLPRPDRLKIFGNQALLADGVSQRFMLDTDVLQRESEVMHGAAIPASADEAVQPSSGFGIDPADRVLRVTTMAQNLAEREMLNPTAVSIEFEEALSLVLPNGIILSLWDSFDASGPKSRKSNFTVLRYWRPGNLIASSTYIDLSPASPVK